MSEQSITEWMVTEGIAENGFAAGHIHQGLKLGGLTWDEQVKRVRLYRKWRTKTDKKNMIPSWQAYELAQAGIDPDNVPARQIDFMVEQ